MAIGYMDMYVMFFFTGYVLTTCFDVVWRVVVIFTMCTKSMARPYQNEKRHKELQCSVLIPWIYIYFRSYRAYVVYSCTVDSNTTSNSYIFLLSMPCRMSFFRHIFFALFFLFIFLKSRIYYIYSYLYLYNINKAASKTKDQTWI